MTESSKVTEAMVEAAKAAYLECHKDSNDCYVDTWISAMLSAALVQAPVQVGEIEVKALEDPIREAAAFLLWYKDRGKNTDDCAEAWDALRSAIRSHSVVTPEKIDEALSSALALPLPVQELVAWQVDGPGSGGWTVTCQPEVWKSRGYNVRPLYLHPETASVREGWRLVPAEATIEMVDAWEDAYAKAPEGSGHVWAWEDAYRAMLAASPTEGQKGSTDV